MSTQDKPITTPAVRAAEAICKAEQDDSVYAVLDASTYATIIDQQTHLPELVEAALMLTERIKLWQAGVAEGVELIGLSNELRSVLERVKGEK